MSISAAIDMLTTTFVRVSACATGVDQRVPTTEAKRMKLLDHRVEAAVVVDHGRDDARCVPLLDRNAVED